jgi:hypothetical protein
MASRWERNNNPGNVSIGRLTQGFGGVSGIDPLRDQPGYGTFPSMSAGYGAFNQLFQSRIDSGRNTLALLGPVYAQDPKWAAGVSSISGVGINEPITSANAQSVQYGILRHETGMSDSQANSIIGSGGAGGASGGMTAPSGGSDAFSPFVSDIGPGGGPLYGNAADQRQDIAQDWSGGAGQAVTYNTPAMADNFAPSSGDQQGLNSITQMTPQQAQELGFPNPNTGLPPTSSGSPSVLGVASGDGSASSSGGNPFDTSGMSPAAQQSGQGGGLTSQVQNFAGGGGGGSSGGGSDSASGSPVYLTDPHGVASVAGESAKKGAEELGKNIQSTGQAADTQVQSSTTQLTQEGTALGNFVGNLTSGGGGILPRIGVGLLALILVAAGLWMMKDNPPAMPQLKPAR